MDTGDPGSILDAPSRKNSAYSQAAPTPKNPADVLHNKAKRIEFLDKGAS